MRGCPRRAALLMHDVRQRVQGFAADFFLSISSLSPNRNKKIATVHMDELISMAVCLYRRRDIADEQLRW